MHKLLDDFLRRQCVKHPSATVPLADFMAAFRATIPASSLESWRRERVIAGLRAGGFSVGVIDRVFHVGGVTLARHWEERGGQLVAVAHA